MGKRAILYARVSTDEQAEKGYSLPTQLEAMREYATRHGFDVSGPGCEIIDDYSGAKLDRPGLDRVRAMFEAREADVLIVFSPDRLTRSLAHSLILREELHRAGIELHYVNRGKSENTPESRMTENIEAVFADYWRAKIIEGSRRGRLAKARAGKWVGQGVPYGYRKEGRQSESQLIINKEEAAIVRRIFAMYLGVGEKPATCQTIAVRLTAEGVPPPSRGVKGRGWHALTVLRIIERRSYIGEFQYCGHITYLPELTVIDRATFDAAQARRATNKERAARNQKHEYLVGSYLFCACKRRMTGFYVTSYLKSTGQVLYRRYRCMIKIDEHLRACKEQNLVADKVEAMVWEWLTRLMDDPGLDNAIQDYIGRRENELKTKRERISQLDALMERDGRQTVLLAADLRAMIGEAGRAAIRAQINALDTNIISMSKERTLLLGEIEQREISEADAALIKRYAAAINGRMQNNPTYEQKRAIFDLLDLRVELRRDEAEFRWLDCTCGLHVEPDPLPYDEQVLLPNHPTR